jgi:hypothetical protein
MSGCGACVRILLLLVAWNAILSGVQNAVAKASGITTPQGIFTLHINDQMHSRSIECLMSGVEKRFYELTGFEAQDYPPVVVVLHGHESSERGLPVLRVDALEGGRPKIQVDLLTQDVASAGTQSGILLVSSMILREYYGGKALQVGSSIPKIPSWFSHGLAYLCLDGISRKTIPAPYLEGGPPPGIEAFLLEKPPDDDNHLLQDNYNARAAYLLQSGLNGEGASIFRKWIRPDSSNDQHCSLSSLPIWPSDWPMQKIERRWLLLMAASSHEVKSTIEQLTPSGSLRKYDNVVKAIPMDASSFQKICKQQGWDFTSQGICSKLSALRQQSNPLVAPLIEGTIDLLKSGRSLPDKKLSDRLSALKLLRADILRQSQAIDAYLDWYEAAKLPVSSGLFDQYLKSSESTIRKGPVGRYLDAIESRGW